ncbi:MAG: hypothetical protein Q8N23_05995 [Archangium sp.]|nr:hypothetical protein [Archangium sp.]MDP3152202.1 hypothetical protein [Archangium sp.]MDP3574917.1 hypothetical protein [Archangium sp.]
MKKPVEELLAVVVALVVLGLLAFAFVSFLTFEHDVSDWISDGGDTTTRR